MHSYNYVGERVEYRFVWYPRKCCISGRWIWMTKTAHIIPRYHNVDSFVYDTDELSMALLDGRMFCDVHGRYFWHAPVLKRLKRN